MIYDTEQKVLDAVWEHFVTNKSPASIDMRSISCLYRDGKGNKCAIGVLLPDELYNPKFEEGDLCNVYDVLVENNIIDNVSIGFLRDVQNAHDANAEYPNVFHNTVKSRLTLIAHEYGLAVPEDN